MNKNALVTIEERQGKSPQYRKKKERKYAREGTSSGHAEQDFGKCGTNKGKVWDNELQERKMHMGRKVEGVWGSTLEE